MVTIGCLLARIAYTANIQENYQFVTLPPGATAPLGRITPRNSSRQAVLKARKGFSASLSKSSTTSRKVLFGARYVSMITRTTLSALSTIRGDDSTRILLTNA